jgi:hypothetical protein
VSAAEDGAAPITPATRGSAAGGSLVKAHGGIKRKRPPAPPHSHGKCGATWTGTRASHCSGCCRTWSGVTLFDAHRKITGEHGTCLDPTEVAERVGCPVELRDGVWSYPEMDEATKLARFGSAS